MELVRYAVPKSYTEVVIAPLGDIQWSGDDGPTAQDHLRRHIDRCLERNAWFIGMGDYTDFMSPSNRDKFTSAKFYDTSNRVIKNASDTLVSEVYEKFLKPTRGRWIGLLEGHHFFEFGGVHSDQVIADLLGTRLLGTSAFIHIEPCDVTLLATHGLGGGILPGTGSNKLYHWAAGLEGADVYLMGHNTKLSSVRLSRPRPVWTPEPDLVHRDIHLVNTGGFSKSNIIGHRAGHVPRGDYAEQGMMTPSPLSAPIITIDTKAKRLEDRIRVEV